MNDTSLKKILSEVIDGSNEAFTELSQLYMPLIKKNCYIHGKFDEDLYQELLLHLFLKIPTFPLLVSGGSSHI